MAKGAHSPPIGSSLRRGHCWPNMFGSASYVAFKGSVTPYIHGERVHVGGTGLISGHDANYDSVTEDGKLRLSFDMMGRMVLIDVDQRDVFSVAKKAKRKRGRRRQRHRVQPQAPQHA